MTKNSNDPWVELRNPPQFQSLNGTHPPSTVSMKRENESAAPGRAMVPAVKSTHIRSGSGVLPFDNDHARAGEQYRMIRTRITRHAGAPRVIAVTSAGQGDGKSTTAINIAGALALSADAPVLLIDCDFRRSDMARRLELPNCFAMADVLSGRCGIGKAGVICEQMPALRIIPAGRTNVNPSELLESHWAGICSEVRESCAFAIVDCPPVACVADYALIESAVDAVIMVIRPDHTPRDLCASALKHIPHEKLLGVVMNCVSGWLMGTPNPYAQYYYRTD